MIDREKYILIANIASLDAKVQCYNCNSKDIVSTIDSEVWTSEFLCSKCNHLTVVVWGDKMGGQLDFIEVLCPILNTDFKILISTLKDICIDDINTIDDSNIFVGKKGVINYYNKMFDNYKIDRDIKKKILKKMNISLLKGYYVVNNLPNINDLIKKDKISDEEE